jgi:putative inorganic carbon (HCO3(-)) transporter
VCAVFGLLAVMVIVLTLSRAAWVSTALALGLGLALIVGVWRERHVIPPLIGIAMAVLAALPLMAGFVYDRFANSPYEVLTTRFDQYTVALQVVRDYPLLGFGPGNWINALAQHDFLWLEVLPPHNVVLWVLAETGIVGFVFYLAILVSAAARLVRLIRNRRDLSGRLGMATLIALAATVLVGLTDPTYREPNVFAMFWLLIALSVALPRLPALSAATYLTGRRAAMPRPTLATASPREI